MQKIESLTSYGSGADSDEREPGQAEFFDLDVSLVEGGDEVEMLVQTTDNGCSSTCPNACTNTGVAQLC